jgi:SAM-dependent methyltransferase
MNSSRLTDEAYWDENWGAKQGPLARDHAPSLWRRILTTTPFDRKFWPLVAALAQKPGRVIELGSAPGANLLRWRELLHCDIFGADISGVGLESQRCLFEQHGIDESHSLLADFLDQDFQSRYKESFDVVYSGGLIEHFSDPTEAVSAHLKILRPGGLLVLSIPNLQGIYRHLLPKSIVAVHNISIMAVPEFRRLFPAEVKSLFCGYFGGLNLGIGYTGETAFSRSLLRLQLLVNLLLRIVPVPENRWTSQSLLFIGRKPKS